MHCVTAPALVCTMRFLGLGCVGVCISFWGISIGKDCLRSHFAATGVSRASQPLCSRNINHSCEFTRERKPQKQFRIKVRRHRKLDAGCRSAVGHALLATPAQRAVQTEAPDQGVVEKATLRQFYTGPAVGGARATSAHAGQVAACTLHSRSGCYSTVLCLQHQLCSTLIPMIN